MSIPTSRPFDTVSPPMARQPPVQHYLSRCAWLSRESPPIELSSRGTSVRSSPSQICHPHFSPSPVLSVGSTARLAPPSLPIPPSLAPYTSPTPSQTLHIFPSACPSAHSPPPSLPPPPKRSIKPSNSTHQILEVRLAQPALLRRHLLKTPLGALLHRPLGHGLLVDRRGGHGASDDGLEGEGRTVGGGRSLGVGRKVSK